MSQKAEATYHGADIVTRLQAYGPESDYEAVMGEAANTILRLREANAHLARKLRRDDDE